MTGYPSERDIRAALIERVTVYCRVAGIRPRTLFQRAINDPNFFKKLKGGGNFTIRTYHRVHRYLDKNAPSKPAKRRSNGES